MAFKTADFKKTTRKTGDERLLYPYQIRDDRYTASIGYAITYYERMVGRRRAEFEAETLLEFFGDPRLARGLVACLARTYAWREQTFAEALGDETARALWRAGLATPAALRARLYGLANGRYGGVILPHEREEAIRYLCASIGADRPPTADCRLPTADCREGEGERGRGGADHRPPTTDHRPPTARGRKGVLHTPATDEGVGRASQPNQDVEHTPATDEGVGRASQPNQDVEHTSATDDGQRAEPKYPVITPKQFEQALTLDSEDQHVLVKLGPMPEPHEIVARYNYHSIETALCHAELLRLRLRGPVWGIVRSAHNLARRYRLRYEVSGAPRTLFDEQVELTLYGGRDGMGSWTRAGRRLVRALLRLLAAHPDSLVEGEALVHLRGQTVTLRLDERARKVLGVGAGEGPEALEPWEEDVAEAFQRAWGRAFVAGRTAGWRLRRDPEPLVGAGAIVVPDFALQRGRERLALCLANGRATATALTRDLARLGGRTTALAVIPDHAAETLRICPVPLATFREQPSEAIAALVTTLERKYPRPRPEESLTPWQRLERMIGEEGFVGEQTVAAMLGCPPDEAARVVQRWGGPLLHALPGLGVCAPEMLGEIRHLIEEGELAQRAA
jgi:hypothetical protein